MDCYPNVAMGKDGFVRLSYCKATKISEVQNIIFSFPCASRFQLDTVINNHVSKNRATDGSE